MELGPHGFDDYYAHNRPTNEASRRHYPTQLYAGQQHQVTGFVPSPGASNSSRSEAHCNEQRTPWQPVSDNLNYSEGYGTGTPEGHFSFDGKKPHYTQLTPPGTDESSCIEKGMLDGPSWETDGGDYPMDDGASIHSMTTWSDSKEWESREPGKPKRLVLFDYDWADVNADTPPIPWEEVPSYVDFHANRVAHDYWKWDPDVEKWKHIDEKTGETIYCPSELD